MIKELLQEELPLFRKYLLIEVGYVVFDVATLVVINAVMGTVFPDRSELRHLILFITALLLSVMFYSQAQKAAFQLIENIVARIRSNIIEKVLHTDLKSFERIGKSQIYNAITLDTQIISEVAHIFMWLIDSAMLCVGLLVYLAIICRIAFVFTTAIFIFGVLVYVFQIGRSVKWIEKARDKETELFDSIGDVIHGFKELKINDRKSDDFYRNRLKRASAENRAYRTTSEYSFADGNVLSTIVEMSAFIPILFILPALGNFSIHALLVSVTALLFFPFNQIKDTVPYLVRAWISVERINRLRTELESLESEEVQVAPEQRLSGFQKIDYRRIHFTYTDKEGIPLFSIDDINLSLHPGEIVFITGGNGSGKTTLLNVLTGLYPPFSGSIEIDGREMAMSGHRYLFSAIFTDFHLFDRLYGMKDVEQAKAGEFIRVMELEEKIALEGDRYSTLDLSTGERKRVAMINAMLEDKPIYVFDEWAADQSPHFREYFYLHLLPAFKQQGKTVIAVTHDDHFFHTADRVLKLDYGRLTDTGSGKPAVS